VVEDVLFDLLGGPGESPGGTIVTSQECGSVPAASGIL